MDNRLDEIDKRILYHLSQDARGISAPQIAEEVNVSPGTIRNRISQLEADGVITGYSANIDYEKADRRLTNLYICNTNELDRDKLAKQVLDIPGVVNVRELMTGRGNLQVKAVAEDMSGLAQIGKALVELGLEIEDEGLVEREHHRPYQPFGPTDTYERQRITDFMSLSGDAEIVELTVSVDAPIAGKTVQKATDESLIDTDILIVAIERDDSILTPKGKTEILPDDIVTVLSRGGVAEETVQVFSGTRPARQ